MNGERGFARCRRGVVCGVRELGTGGRDWPRGLVHSQRLEALMEQHQDRLGRNCRQCHVTTEASGPGCFGFPEATGGQIVSRGLASEPQNMLSIPEECAFLRYTKLGIPRSTIFPLLFAVNPRL